MRASPPTDLNHDVRPECDILISYVESPSAEARGAHHVEFRNITVEGTLGDGDYYDNVANHPCVCGNVAYRPGPADPEKKAKRGCRFLVKSGTENRVHVFNNTAVDCRTGCKTLRRRGSMCMTNGYATLTALLAAIMGVSVSAQDAGSLVTPYNVVWESPSQDASGQMPLGNGDIAAGVYAIENDALYLLLAKNDAFNYNGDIFKTGRIKIELSPNPFAHGKPFKQVLDLKTGSIRIAADGVAMRFWADANRPIYHVQIDSLGDVTVRANSDLWERIDGCAWNSTMVPIDPPTQDVRLQRDGKLLWYFAVGDRSAYAADLAYYNVEQMASEYPDPYRFNTFGNLLESPDLKLQDGVLWGTGRSFDIRIHALATLKGVLDDPGVCALVGGIETGDIETFRDQ